MQIRVPLVIVAMISGTAVADPNKDVEITRRILAEDAASGRRTRHVTAAALGAFGAGVALGGLWLMRTEDYGLLGGPLERGAGYLALGVGAVTAIGAPTIQLLKTSQQEDVHAELEREIAAGNGAAGAVHARHMIEDLAEREGRERRNLRIVGATGVVLGAAGTIACVVYRDELGNGIRLPLAGSVLYGGIGALLLALTIGPTTWEGAHSTLAGTSAGVVPIQSGALLAFGGTLD